MLVVDVLDRMMEEAKLATHADAWLPGEPVNHGRTAQVSDRHADQRTRTADYPTSAECSSRIPRPCSKVQTTFASTFSGTAARAHAFRFWEPTGVIDRLIVFESLVGEHETSSGEVLKCDVLVERIPPELQTLLLTCGPRPDCAIMRQTVESHSVARRPNHSKSMGGNTNGNRRRVL